MTTQDVTAIRIPPPRDPIPDGRPELRGTVLFGSRHCTAPGCTRTDCATADGVCGRRCSPPARVFVEFCRPYGADLRIRRRHVVHQKRTGGGVMPYPVGSFFLVSVGGWAGFAIGVGQALAGAPSRYEHAGIVVSADGQVVEAEPGGARVGHLEAYAGRPLMICDGPVRQRLADLQDDGLFHHPPGCVSCAASEARIRADVAAQARKLVGTPYSALDYLALAALHLHLPDRAIRRRVQESGHMICSQLVDAVYSRAGIHLWDDGRLPGDVMPADLAAWAEDWFAAQREQVAP